MILPWERGGKVGRHRVFFYSIDQQQIKNQKIIKIPEYIDESVELWYNSTFSNIPIVKTWKRKSRGNLKIENKEEVIFAYNKPISQVRSKANKSEKQIAGIRELSLQTGSVYPCIYH